jgi:hypothetical protein
MPMNTSVSLEDKEKQLNTIKDRVKELRKALLAGKIEEVEMGIDQLNQQIVEVPLDRRTFNDAVLAFVSSRMSPNYFRALRYSDHHHLYELVEQWFRKQRTIFNGSLGTALSKHLDLMERWDIPKDVVRMILLRMGHSCYN